MISSRRHTLRLLTRLPWLLPGVIALSACGDEIEPVTADKQPAPGGSFPVVSVTYQRGSDIMIQPPAGAPTVLIENASYPRFSPDGEHVAAVRGRDIVMTPVEGGATRVVARAQSPRAVAWDPSGTRIFFTDANRVRVAAVKGAEEAVVVRGHRVLELDVGPGGHLVGTTKGFGYEIHLFNPETGESAHLADGCSASFSPDGRWVTNLLDGHRRMELIATRGDAGPRVIEAPRGIKYDNHVWTNHPDWIAGELEGDKRDIILIHAGDGRVERVTNDGNATRGDVFIHRDATD